MVLQLISFRRMNRIFTSWMSYSKQIPFSICLKNSSVILSGLWLAHLPSTGSAACNCESKSTILRLVNRNLLRTVKVLCIHHLSLQTLTDLDHCW